MPKIAQISAKIGGGVALTLFSLANLAPAHSATFTFNAGDNGLSTITKTVDGITLTISNPSPDPTFIADADGLAVFDNGGINPAARMDSFQLSFDTSVQLNSYNVGYLQFLDGNEVITLTAGSESSVENSPFATGVRNFANMITVAAGQVINVVNSGNDNLDLIQWDQITVTEVSDPATTPEPVSLVALLGIGALGFASRKPK